MTHLVASELRKLRTVRGTWVLTAIGLAVALVSTVGVVTSEAAGSADPGAAGLAASAIGQLSGYVILVLVVGLLVMTTEFRHATIGRTLQLEPSRSRVLLAKLCAGALYGSAFFLAALLLVAAVLLVAPALGAPTPRLGSETARAVWQGWAGMALTGLLGVAVGALVRHQAAAIAGALVWLLLVENLAAALRPDVGRWLPFQALNALSLAGEAVVNEPGTVGPLPPGLALAVFLAYVAVATAAAGVLMTRRDV